MNLIEIIKQLNSRWKGGKGYFKFVEEQHRLKFYEGGTYFSELDLHEKKLRPPQRHIRGGPFGKDFFFFISEAKVLAYCELHRSFYPWKARVWALSPTGEFPGVAYVLLPDEERVEYLDSMDAYTLFVYKIATQYHANINLRPLVGYRRIKQEGILLKGRCDICERILANENTSIVKKILKGGVEVTQCDACFQLK